MATPTIVPPAALVVVDSCPQFNNCSDVGVCTPTGCSCQQYFLQANCSVMFNDAYGEWYTGFQYSAMFMMALVIAIAAFNLLHRTAAAYRLRRPGVRMNFRTAVILVNMLACAVRILWLVDPNALEGVYSKWLARGLLLRLPQALWFVAFTILILMWNAVLSTVYKSAIPMKMQVMIASVMVAILLGTTLVSSFMLATDWQSPVYGFIGNGIMAVYVIGWMVVGLRKCYHVYLLLRKHFDAVSKEHNARFVFVMRVTFNTLVWAVTICVVLVSSILATFIFRIGPNTGQHPDLFMGFLFLIHVLMEPALAGLLVYSSYSPAPLGVMASFGCTSLTDANGEPMLWVGNPIYTSDWSRA